MQFRILGPLEVADGHGAISFDAPKQRTLLAVLLLHANEVVSSERLTDELWGESPPATSTKVVQTYVSQLRKALGSDSIVTRPPGYMLQVEEGALDAERFHRLTSEAHELVAKGETAKADALYREGLALWRGPALADVAFESFASNEVEGLDEERLRALMDWIDCELALGRHHELVSELETLVGQYPLRERLRGQLMLALYRSGRQADALAAYQDTRRTLVDELGLEPSEELQELERAILTHDAALDGPAPSATERSTRRRVLSRRVLVTAIPVLIAAVAGLAFALHSGPHSSQLLKPNSVGFIDAKSGRITRHFTLGRQPNSLTVAFDHLWVSTYRDELVTRFDRLSGNPVTIPVGAHPVSLTADRNKVWVWTVDGRLVPIDPRFNEPEDPLRMGVAPDIPQQGGGRVTYGGGFLWVSVPLLTVLKVDPANSERPRAIHPDDGVRSAIAYGNGAAWVATYSGVVPIKGLFAGEGVPLGQVRGLAFGARSLWAISGSDMNQRIGAGLWRIDLRGRVSDLRIDVGDDPVAVVWADGSIWVASRSDWTVKRIDPANPSKVAQTIPLGAPPKALAADPDGKGIWVGVG